MPSAPTADFVRCLYEDCVRPGVKRSAFADLEGRKGRKGLGLRLKYGSTETIRRIPTADSRAFPWPL